MNKEELRAAILSADISEPYGYGCGESMAFETGVELALGRAAELACLAVGDGIELDVTDNPNWDLEIPLVMGAVERGALAHRIRAWGAQQFAAGKAAALADLHPHYEAEKQRADRLQAQANEAAFDKLLSNEPQRALAQHDADTYGMGLMVDGKRVDPGRVQMFLPKPRPEFVLRATVGTARINPRGDEATVLGRQEIDVPCSHTYEFDGHQGFKTVWRCSKCGTERVR